MGLLLQIALTIAVQRNIIVLRFGVIQLLDGDHVHLGPVAHHDARQFARGRSPRASSPDRPIWRVPARARSARR